MPPGIGATAGAIIEQPDLTGPLKGNRRLSPDFAGSQFKRNRIACRNGRPRRTECQGVNAGVGIQNDIVGQRVARPGTVLELKPGIDSLDAVAIGERDSRL